MLVTDHYKSLKRAKERNLNYGHYFSLITKSSKRIYKIKTDEQKKKCKYFVVNTMYWIKLHGRRYFIQIT